MAESNKSIGIYYGTDGIYLVISSSTRPVKLFSVSNAVTQSKTLGTADFLTEGGSGQQEVTQKLQQALLKYNINKLNLNLSLPTKDIIFRSFVIPWMQSHEIKGVVDFEAGKYVPFPLSELSYSYHPSTINVSGSKRIRVTFVAIKKSELEKYTNLLHHANVKIDSVEPAATSLIRALIHKGILSPNQTVAIVCKNRTSGKIVIVDESIPQFVREFQLKLPQDTAGSVNQSEIKDRLQGEIRISLDYFNRQNNQSQAKEIIFISEEDCSQIAATLQEDLSLPIRPFQIKSIVEHPDSKEMEYINSYGASLTKSVRIQENFDLSQKTKQGSMFQQSSFNAREINYKKPILAGIACALLVGLMFFFTSSRIKTPKMKLDKLKVDLASVQIFDAAQLSRDAEAMSDKLEIYENTLVKSKTSEFLSLIPDLIPEGIWINTMEITYEDPMFDSGRALSRSRTTNRSRVTTTTKAEIQKPNLNIVINGYAYLKNTNKQFQLVDSFVEKLQENEVFSNTFNSIRSGEKSRDTIDKYAVTTFIITCE